MAEKQTAPKELQMGFQWHLTDQCEQRYKYSCIFGEDPCKVLYSMPFDEMKEVVDRCLA